MGISGCSTSVNRFPGTKGCADGFIAEVVNTALVVIGVVEGVTMEIVLTEFTTAGTCCFPAVTLLIDTTGKVA